MTDVSPWYGILPIGLLVIMALLMARAWAVRRFLIGAPPNRRRFRLPKSRLKWG